MTPRDVDELTPAEYQAFWRFAENDVKAQARAIRKAQQRKR
jgi:hypothetical protein